MASEPALRVIMRRLREIMEEGGDGQSRLDNIVRQIAGVMIAEVCSIYLKRQDGSLELFATEGLKPEAVHDTRLKRGEGLVGRCAELNEPINEPDAQQHPSFSYRPETGEEAYHSLLAVPIQRAGTVLGVLVVQNHTMKEYTDEDMEVLQATAMVVTEVLSSGAVAGSEAASEFSKSASSVHQGEPMSDGIALGHVVLHEPRIVVTQLLSEDPASELDRLDGAIEALRQSLDEMFSQERLAHAGEHRDVLEAYRMFAHDRGWERRLREAAQAGLTAEAAVDRVQNTTRARMLRQADPYWRERVRDFDDLSDRLLRILAGHETGSKANAELPPDTILVARSMGPAELLDYDRSKLRGLVISDGSGQSHVAIVAKALGIAAVGQVERVVDYVSAGDAIIVDGENGEVHVRPSSDVVSSYTDKVRFRAKRQLKYQQLREKPAVTVDGRRIGLQVNAGLVVDMPHVAESGADGVGLFRTELQFMLADTFPRTEKQAQVYRAVLDEAAGLPVIFRALDIGGDKPLPYLRSSVEENPALGWRAIRMSLDRPALLRMQLRALIRAASDAELHVMIPMVTLPAEIDEVRAILDRELALERSRGRPVPKAIRLGAMLEVPSLLFDMDAFMARVDFVSVGSNDLLQFMYAADRGNARVGKRYAPLSLPFLRALREIAKSGRRNRTPVTLCGEMAGDPFQAMALIGLGYRTLSMAASAIGPVKAMVLSLDSRRICVEMDALLKQETADVEAALKRFVIAHDVDV